MSRRDWKGLVPHEHGSWAYLLGPPAAALIAARSAAAPLLWFAGSLLLFCAFQAFAAALRRTASWSTSGTLVGGAGVILILRAASDLPFALLSLAPGALTATLGLFSRRGRLGRQAVLEVLGIASLAIQGGAGLLLGGGGLSEAAVLAIASTTYFLLSLIWVRVRLGAEIPGRAPLLPRGWNIPASLLLLTASATAGIALGGSLVGFLPGIYIGRLLLPVPRRADLKLHIPRLGVQEAIAAAIFATGLGLYLPR